MALGERIITIRKSAGLSQEQFGLLLGVSRQSVSKWEMDQAKPDLEYIVKIADSFQVSTDYILGKEELQVGSEQNLLLITKQKLRFQFGIFLTILSTVLFIMLYSIRVEGIGFEVWNIYIYGFWAWMFVNKFVLIAVILIMMLFVTGITICAKQAFNKKKRR